MAAPLTFIPDILDEHLEEVAMLLARRATLAQSPTAQLHHLADLDERLLAHLDGVNAVGEAAGEPLRTLITGDDPSAVRGAAFVLLRGDVPEARALMREAFLAATGEPVLAMADALLLGPADRAAEVAALRADDDDPLAAVSCALVLARHAGRRPAAEWLAAQCGDDSPPVREQAWRLVGELGSALDPRSHAAGARDEEPAVRRAALLAAALCRLPGILSVVRKVAEHPAKEDADALRLLAVLGTPTDGKRIQYVATERSLGPLRCELVGLYGAPAHVPLLLDAMHDEDPRVALAAGAAFTRITGVDVESAERVTLPPEDGSAPDEFEAEFLDEALLPDEARARAHWDGAGAALAPLGRICHGVDATGPLDAAVVPSLDLETLWWQRVRHRFQGWTMAPGTDPDVFPVMSPPAGAAGRDARR